MRVEGNTTGLVFDIQRFALHDGPGIRTTVFLKGCPLSCLWCHNPESRSFRRQLSFDEDRCTHCLHCVDVCNTGALEVVDERLVVHHDLCDGCGGCVDRCPYDALAVIGGEKTVDQVIAEVEKDRAYYQRSGGGLTISGGEPLAQPGFTVALLRRAKEAGIHTCLDTSGAVHPRRIQEALPYVDVFLYDYKATPESAHVRLTGVSNELVLENLEYLYQKGANIILRCPLIPGVNDSTRHLKGIARLSRKYPNLLDVQLMAYHNMGKDKAHRLGMAYPLREHPSAGETDKERWLWTLVAHGCDRAVLG